MRSPAVMEQAAGVTLTPEQLAVVEAPEREVLVHAAAGAGKTTVLAHRIAWLLRQGTPPETILAVVFTRAAAAILRQRITALVGDGIQVAIGTIQSLALSWVGPILEEVATPGQEAEIFDSLYEGADRRAPRSIVAREAIATAIAMYEADEDDLDAFSMRSVEVLLHRLLRRRLIPLWDLVPRARVAVTRPDGPLYRHILLDEAQDVTRAELALLRQVLVDGGTFTAVGDPRQSIYGWRFGRGVAGEPTHRIRTSLRFGAELATNANAVANAFAAEHITGRDAMPGEVIRIQDTAHFKDLCKEDPSRTLVLARRHRSWSRRDRRWSCERLAHALGSRAVHVGPAAYALDDESSAFDAVRAKGRAVVTTVHAAKGAEADTTIVALDPEDQNLEEFRVRYVAYTRACRRLVIIETPPPENCIW